MSQDKAPAADPAEENAFFPSPYSLSQYTSSKTDFDGTTYPVKYNGGKWRILMIATDERYVLMSNGTFFSTGNHPVEMLLPMWHFDAAGFDVDIVTLSGNPVKLEMWAMPREDAAVGSIYKKYLAKLRSPRKLSEVIDEALGANSPYIGVFVPGGHGVLAKIPESREVKRVLTWFTKNDRFVVTLCHGPACLLAAGVDESKDSYIYNGYEICVFPDALDEGPNQAIGYMPGRLIKPVGANLLALGVKILNSGITGQVHRDRYLLTGDSPLASHNLGKLAAAALLADPRCK
jgi:molecular chaperone Hsp31 and glyoxalase 3